jgi:hypothetical protein
MKRKTDTDEVAAALREVAEEDRAEEASRHASKATVAVVEPKKPAGELALHGTPERRYQPPAPIRVIVTDLDISFGSLLWIRIKLGFVALLAYILPTLVAFSLVLHWLLVGTVTPR